MTPKIKELTARLREKEKLLSEEILKRRSAEDKLTEARETFKLALREMPVIIFATDDDGSLVFFNREFERVSGYQAADLAENPEMLQFLFQIDKDELPMKPDASGEWRFLGKDGQEKAVFWSQVSDYPPLPGWRSWKVGMDVTELKATQARIKVLSGLLPICSNCKKIRDDTGYWSKLEAYIQDHSEADFTHGICPSCSKQLYPELYDKDKEKK
jgi:PAS domain S-box-containing protein